MFLTAYESDKYTFIMLPKAVRKGSVIYIHGTYSRLPELYL